MPVDLVAEALRTLGFPVERTGRNDLFLEGAKVSGFAWEAIGGMSVVHGTLLHSTDINVMDLLVGRKKGKYRGTAMALSLIHISRSAGGGACTMRGKALSDRGSDA